MEKTLLTIFTNNGIEQDKAKAFLKEHLDKYKKYVFIHKTSQIAKNNPSCNYEYWEILGDALLTKLVVWYIPKRFPQLRNKEGVQLISQLKAQIISCQSYASLAMKLKFHEIIDICPELMMDMPVSLLEDVFEAFFGFTEHYWNVYTKSNQGHVLCSKILTTLLDKEQYSLEFEDLFDPIQRLVQLQQKHKLDIVEENDTAGLYKKSNIFLNTTDGKKPLGFGRAHTIADAKKIACTVAIQSLEHLNYSLETPELYTKIQPKPATNKRPTIQPKPCSTNKRPKSK